MRGLLMSPEFRDQVARVVRQVLRSERDSKEIGDRNRKKDSLPIVVLGEYLANAPDRFNDATLPSAVAYYVKRADPTNWAIDLTRQITLYNRAENIAYVGDTLGTYSLVLGKPCFFPFDCAAASSSVSGSTVSGATSGGSPSGGAPPI